MKVSLNTVKQYIDFELPPVDELVKRINEQLGGVERLVMMKYGIEDVRHFESAKLDFLRQF